MTGFLRGALFAALLTPAGTLAQYTPWAEQDVPMRLLWGDTHLHSSFSVDANTMGNTGLTPANAYRFARGEPVHATNGMIARLDTPLDFLVVSDHAEQLGTMMKLRAGDPRLLNNEETKTFHEALSSSDSDEAAAQAMRSFLAKMASGVAMFDSPEVSSEVWREYIAISDQYYEPGVFTPLIGFEWTSMPDSNNLHRVVIYADDADKAGQLQPVSSNDDENPASLWTFMERYEKTTGGRILAIPHNGNLSNGRMFPLTDYNGNAIDRAYAERRARLEPLVEVTQIKGDGETHPLLSPDDEFADFETWDGGNFAALNKPNKEDNMLRFEYARSALQLGLQLQADTGANPYQFGMIGSTDSHTSLATGAEDNFYGKASMVEPGSDRTLAGQSGLSDSTHPDTQLTQGWTFTASGYTGVWARDNTRQEIFDAMQRREVYATTGSRISLRFFGGWEFSEEDAFSPHLARTGYQKGVPMGGQLASGKRAPTFIIAALKDPQGANLDRIQIVKGWRDGKGQLREKVYNVAVAGDRALKRDGSVAPLKHTVDLKTATYRNTIGDAALSAFWQDPDFNSGERAFYYARVIEIPVPRWSVYDAVRLGKPLDRNDPKIIQDRAYSSPIWYGP